MRTKPSIINGAIPYNSQKDRDFESLLRDLYLEEARTNRIPGEAFDKVDLMSGIGEEGQDCILIKDNQKVGVIQCKKYARPLSAGICLDEIIKFSIFALNRSDEFGSKNSILYYLATSTGFGNEAVEILNQFSNYVTNSKNTIEKRAASIIGKSKKLNKLKTTSILSDLIDFLKKLKITLVPPGTLDLLLQKYPHIKERYFHLEVVIRNPGDIHFQCTKKSYFSWKFRAKIDNCSDFTITAKVSWVFYTLKINNRVEQRVLSLFGYKKNLSFSIPYECHYKTGVIYIAVDRLLATINTISIEVDDMLLHIEN